MSGRLQLGITLATGCLAFALGTAPALALNTRSAVALEGSDSAACTVALPCRTLVQALTQTTPGGEILVKDSAGFGPITITQAVTINAPPGVIGFITALSGDAITINAGASDTVIVTGLYLDGQGSGVNGVTVNTVGSFSIGGSTITGFTGNPINYVNNSGGNQKLTVGNSSFYSNGGPVNVKPISATSVIGSIRGLALSSTGIVVDNTTATTANMAVLIDNSILRYNSGTAVTVNSSGASSFVQVHLDKSEVLSVNTAFSANGTNALIDFSESAIMNMTNVAVTTSSGVVKSFTNNAIDAQNNTGYSSRPLQ